MNTNKLAILAKKCKALSEDVETPRHLSSFFEDMASILYDLRTGLNEIRDELDKAKRDIRHLD